jgi:glyoxylase-like metal-dependent hydrolase (beta-lactamase superfamily II)
MELYSIHAGGFKLDGGAMFGVVPKSLWSRTNPADSNNMCPWAMRCLLIEDGDRLMLIDTGIGDKQDERFYSFYYLFGDSNLIGEIRKAGFHEDQITDVFLTHLHFDHCGGAIKFNDGRTHFEPVFKNARYWSTQRHWDWATNPNPREKASFLKENILPIQESGQLHFVERQGDRTLEAFPGIDIFFADGHTDAQMIPMIKYKGETLVYMADLLPSTGHIPLAWVMGYDTRPLLTLDEKAKFMKEAAEKEYILFLEHDHYSECCRVHQTEKGIRLRDTFDLASI